MNKQYIEDFLQSIRELRSNESNFETLNHKLEESLSQDIPGILRESLKEIKEKQAAVYLQAHEGGASAWPEFERFVAALETALVDALKQP